jgi:CubicO group peptidase (beta-lactamase class C family)
MSDDLNPLGLEDDHFEPSDDPQPAELHSGDDYEPPPPADVFEWTPERAGAVIKAGGFVLHTADSMSHEPGGETLWKATEQDALDAGAPLSRILNRYEPARRLAGVVDEAEFAAAMFSYAKRNLGQRGQLVRQKRQRQAAAESAAGDTAWQERDEPLEQGGSDYFGGAPTEEPGV